MEFRYDLRSAYSSGSLPDFQRTTSRDSPRASSSRRLIRNLRSVRVIAHGSVLVPSSVRQNTNVASPVPLSQETLKEPEGTGSEGGSGVGDEHGRHWRPPGDQ